MSHCHIITSVGPLCDYVADKVPGPGSHLAIVPPPRHRLIVTNQRTGDLFNYSWSKYNPKMYCQVFVPIHALTLICTMTLIIWHTLRYPIFWYHWGITLNSFQKGLILNTEYSWFVDVDVGEVMNLDLSVLQSCQILYPIKVRSGLSTHESHC